MARSEFYPGSQIILPFFPNALFNEDNIWQFIQCTAKFARLCEDELKNGM